MHEIILEMLKILFEKFSLAVLFLSTLVVFHYIGIDIKEFFLGIWKYLEGYKITTIGIIYLSFNYILFKYIIKSKTNVEIDYSSVLSNQRIMMENLASLGKMMATSTENLIKINNYMKKIPNKDVLLELLISKTILFQINFIITLLKDACFNNNSARVRETRVYTLTEELKNLSEEYIKDLYDSSRMLLDIKAKQLISTETESFINNLKNTYPGSTDNYLIYILETSVELKKLSDKITSIIEAHILIKDLSETTEKEEE